MLLAQDVTVEQQGAYWVRTATGAVPMPTQTRFRVMARAHITVRGSNVENVTCKLVERLKARSKVDAHRLLGGLTTRTFTSGETITLALAQKILNGAKVTADLEVNVPRRVKMVYLENDGDVEAYDLEGSVQITTIAGLIRCDPIRGTVFGNTGGGEIRLGKIGG